MIKRTVVTALLAVATIAQAQGPTLRIAGGGYIATGVQRDHLKNGRLDAIQLSQPISRAITLTGTFSWARSNDLAATDAPKLDVFTSDIGIESCFHEFFVKSPVTLKTFGGIGGGARSYNYRKLDVDATNNLAGYVAAGGEAGMGRIALRVEARDYATGFKPLVGGGKSEARNDVVILATVRFNRRAAEGR